MKVKDFAGNITKNWPPTGYIVDINSTTLKSQYHLYARQLLRELYPVQIILEEVPLPNLNLYFDFYTPHNHTAYEINGEQHSEYNRFFYKTKADFQRAKTNDNRKSAWCQLNDITLIILDYKDKENWKNILWNKK